ncbi:HAD-IA family hydrolase [Dyadobacter aurulentus]|uniref:HAD-IA family hydrolase n=1 Tax=Dyadobacter sp. UC 10 TaxID=2605428 RepID=UPI0011F374E1|nr:HAD-IA family hydrolase [Dyadobacter sp. UC 10]KAA0992211.1 HAD-IA family hydrolase [Dyadobacter sp. UC 10]
MVKYVIFDFDGTLADSREVFVPLYNQIARKHNYRPIEPDGLEYLKTLSIRERCRYLKVPLYRIPFLASEFLGLYKAALSQVKLFKGIEELINALHNNGLQIAIISTNSERNISDFLAANGIDKISKIYCSTSLFGKDKLIRGFLKKYNLKPNEVLYVGDEVRDIEACKKAGVKIAWVSWGYDSMETALRANPDFVVLEPAGVLDVVLEKCAG